VVDLFGRALHPMREPANDMLSVIGIDLAHVCDPPVCLVGVASDVYGRPVLIEHIAPAPLDPSPVRNQPVRHDLRFTRCPGQLLDRLVLIEPLRCGHFLGLIVVADDRFTVPAG